MADTRRLTYTQISQLLQGIGERFHWDPIVENGNIIGLQQAGQSVTLEPGGQFELSGATLETLHETCAEVNSHLYQVSSTSCSSRSSWQWCTSTLCWLALFFQVLKYLALFQVRSVGEELGIAFLGAGFDPKWGLGDIERMPKER